jgi:hypothetical protein
MIANVEAEQSNRKLIPSERSAFKRLREQLPDDGQSSSNEQPPLKRSAFKRFQRPSS